MRTVELGEVLANGELRNGISPSTNGSVAGEVLTLGAVTGEEFDPTARKAAMFAGEVPESQQVRSGLLMFCRGNGNANFVARAVIADCDMPGVAFPDTVIAGRLDESQCLPRAFTYLWSSDAVRQQVRAISRTTNGTFKVNQASLARVRVPLPSMSEQRRIARVLDQADLLRSKRRKAIALHDLLVSSIFDAMFGEISTSVPLSEMILEFRYGTSNKSAADGLPALRIPNVVRGSLDLSDLKTVPVTPAERARLQLRSGDVLLVRSNGNPEYVGRCAVFDEQAIAEAGWDPESFIYASYLIRARPDPEMVDSTFLSAFLSSRVGRSALRRRAKTSAGQYNINVEGLGAVRVPAAKMDEQRIFAQRVEELNARCALLRRALAKDEELFASLKSCAFSGTL